MDRNPFSECKYTLLKNEDQMVNEIMDEQQKIDNKLKKEKSDKYPEIQDEDNGFCSFNFLNIFSGWRFFPSF